MLQRDQLAKLLRFGAVGVIVMVAFMGMNALIGRWVGPQAAFFLAYPPALLLHFLLNKLWTFQDRRATSGRHLAEYLHTVVVTFLIQWPVFTVLQGAMGAPNWLAAGVANLVQMGASFLLMQFRVFRQAGAADEPPADEATRIAWHRLVTLLVFLATAALLIWTAVPTGRFPRPEGRQYDYYNLLVHGFRKGTLAMDIEVPAALRQLENPYDPANRVGVGVPQDVSYRDGKFYLYFGVVPAVTVFWPWQAVAGSDLPFVYPMLGYVLAAYGLWAWLWLRVLKDFLPRTGLLVKGCGLIVLGACGGYLALARRGSIWELPIAAGQAHLLASMVAGYLAWRSPRPWPWLAAMGLLFGLALGCRPTLIATAFGPAVWLWLVAQKRRHEGGRFWVAFTQGTAMAAAPAAVVVAALLVYNVARFGSPSEFGLNYQLTGNHEAKATHFSLSFVPFNAQLYFTEMPRWGRYFPFLFPIDGPKAPAGYYGAEYVFGALVVCPLLWWAVGLAWIRRLAGGIGVGIVLPWLVVAGGSTALLLCFNTAAPRYAADFMGWWLWLALVGAALLGEVLPRNGSRLGWNAVTLVASLVSLGCSFCASADYYGIFKAANPEGYARVERWANTPTGWWDTWYRDDVGPIEMTMTFPRIPSGTVEPLLTQGFSYMTDHLFVYYLGDNQLQFGYRHGSEPHILGKVLRYEPERAYTVRLSMGGLFPPERHAYFDGWPAPAVWAKRRWVEVRVDGEKVLDRSAESFVVPVGLRIGVDFASGLYGRRFTGTFTGVRRVTEQAIGRSFGAVEGAAASGVELDVEFPSGVETGHQPLVVLGAAGNADALSVRMVGASTYVLAYECWGAGQWESEPMAVPPERRALLRVRFGNQLALPEASPLNALRKTLVVWQDGTLVWATQLQGQTRRGAPMMIAENLIGSTAMGGFFKGKLFGWRSMPVLEDWPSGPFSDAILAVVGRGVGTEPLVAMGPTGRADTLAVQWLSEGRARLIYDHWGSGSVMSDPFPWPSGPRKVTVTLPSFADASGVHGEAEGRLRVQVDGETVWDRTVAYHRNAGGPWVIGENRAGSSVCASALSALVIDARPGGLSEGKP